VNRTFGNTGDEFGFLYRSGVDGNLVGTVQENRFARSTELMPPPTVRG